MEKLLLFTDGSADAKTGTGFGAFLALFETGHSPESYINRVKVKRYENTSSARLELETLLWALNETGKPENKIKVYTDSQNILKLPERREKLEMNNFMSRKGRPLNNRDLYIAFYKITDKLDCEFIKVRGHMSSRSKDFTDQLFTLVDRESRKALRRTQKGIGSK